MLVSRAFWIARRRRRLPSGLPPPCFAATMISRVTLVNVLPRSASILPFLSRMLCHLECPDIAPCPLHPPACARRGVKDRSLVQELSVETVSLLRSGRGRLESVGTH